MSGLWHLTLNLLFPQVWERVVLCLRVKAQESSCWDLFPSFATQHHVTLGKSNELSKTPVFLSVKWEWLMEIVRVSFGNPCGVLRGPYRFKVFTYLFISLRASYAPPGACLSTGENPRHSPGYLEMIVPCLPPCSGKWAVHHLTIRGSILYLTVLPSLCTGDKSQGASPPLLFDQWDSFSPSHWTSY